MPPLFGSRYLFCLGVRDDEGRLYLTEREPFRYQPFPDNRMHTVVEGVCARFRVSHKRSQVFRKYFNSIP